MPSASASQRAQERDSDGPVARGFVDSCAAPPALACFPGPPGQDIRWSSSPTRRRLSADRKSAARPRWSSPGPHLCAFPSGARQNPGPSSARSAALSPSALRCCSELARAIGALQLVDQDVDAVIHVVGLRGCLRSAGSWSDRGGSASSETGSCRWRPPVAGPATQLPWRCARDTPRPGSPANSTTTMTSTAPKLNKVFCRSSCYSSACCCRTCLDADRTAPVSA